MNWSAAIDLGIALLGLLLGTFAEEIADDYYDGAILRAIGFGIMIGAMALLALHLTILPMVTNT